MKNQQNFNDSQAEKSSSLSLLIEIDNSFKLNFNIHPDSYEFLIKFTESFLEQWKASKKRKKTMNWNAMHCSSTSMMKRLWEKNFQAVIKCLNIPLITTWCSMLWIRIRTTMKIRIDFRRRSFPTTFIWHWSINIYHCSSIMTTTETWRIERRNRLTLLRPIWSVSRHYKTLSKLNSVLSTINLNIHSWMAFCFKATSYRTWKEWR